MIDPIAKLLGPWASELCTASVLLRLFLAVGFAAVIGCERASKRHSAGLRTFILVSFGSAVAMLLDRFLMETTSDSLPILSAATVIGGVMLSGNSILFSSRSQIKGLTTSAGLWTCGIIGLTAGAGLYTVTVAAFCFLLCILTYLPGIEAYLTDRSNHFEVHLELTSRASLQDFVTTIRRLGMSIDDIEANAAYIGSGLSVYSVMISVSSQELKKYKTHSEIIEALRTLDYVYHIEEMQQSGVRRP